jgi:hypothetical protein
VGPIRAFTLRYNCVAQLSTGYEYSNVQCWAKLQLYDRTFARERFIGNHISSETTFRRKRTLVILNPNPAIFSSEMMVHLPEELFVGSHLRRKPLFVGNESWLFLTLTRRSFRRKTPSSETTVRRKPQP